MAVLYALSQVIGDGTLNIDPDHPDTTGPYRPRAALYGQFVVVYAEPVGEWCLVKLVDSDEDGAKNDGGLIVLPPPGHVWTTQEVNLGNLRLSQQGFPNDLISVGMDTEDVVDSVGGYIRPDWSLALPFSVAGQ